MTTAAAPVATPRRVAIVGNAPELADQASRIDAADWVVRFNNAAGFGGVSGQRVTHLTLVNHGGQMREWLSDPGFVDRPVVREAGSFLLPFSPKHPVDDDVRDEVVRDEDGRDWTDQARTMLAPLAVPIVILPDAVRLEADAMLDIDASRGEAPSTGFLVALHLLQALGPSVEFDIHGFGFAGWPGHRWDRERAWFEDLAAKRRLRLHAPDQPAGP